MNTQGLAEPLSGQAATHANHNPFAFKFYSLVKKNEGNVFFSPLSIAAAFAMVREGARGKTAQELDAAFHFASDHQARQAGFESLMRGLNEANSKYNLKIANALWAQEDYKFLPDYTTTLQKHYNAKAQNLDFKRKTEEARKTINLWVENQTENKIKDLFPFGALNNSVRLVLTNAIYFKGLWETQFDPKLTRKEDFFHSPQKTTKADMMRPAKNNQNFNYAETEDLQILELPYQGNRLSMFVLLPRKNDLTGLENILSAEKLLEWKNILKTSEVRVFLPKFTFKSNYSLNNYLKELGVTSTFREGQADFSGMDGTKSLFIGSAIHQAFVEVNEEGTEAAAATGVSVGITSMPVRTTPIFRADHPFLFLIQDRMNGNILFLGRVVNP